MLLPQPLFAIPFALFFGLIFAEGEDAYAGAYLVCLCFGVCIILANWAVEEFAVARFVGDIAAPGARTVLRSMAFHAGASILGAAVAAILIHLFIAPGFLGSGRAILIVAIFTLLFLVLFTGVIYAVVFYQHAMARARTDEELKVARRIQSAFLPSKFPQLGRLDVHALNVSSKEVSGDIYDIVAEDDGTVLLAIADVSGKGVPAALLSSMLQASLRTQAGVPLPAPARPSPSASAILANINRLVVQSTAVEQFATFFLARVDPRTLRMSYANAGHNYPLLMRGNGERNWLDQGGIVLGIMDPAGYVDAQVDLAPGDRLVFYTDGISEAQDAQGEFFGEERLCDLLQSLPADLSSCEIIERVLERLRAFLGDVEPGDDMTLLVMRVTA